MELQSAINKYINQKTSLHKMIWKTVHVSMNLKFTYKISFPCSFQFIQKYLFMWNQTDTEVKTKDLDFHGLLFAQ